MKEETLRRIYALKDRVDTETLGFISEIIVDVFKEGIQIGMTAAKQEACNV